MRLIYVLHFVSRPSLQTKENVVRMEANDT